MGHPFVFGVVTVRADHRWMGMQHEGFIDPETLGEWYGDAFVFHEPFTLRDGDGQPHDVRVLNTANMILEGGITKEDVIHALVNAVPGDRA